uniref:LAGLIDADG endonuclease n=1 Tax=Ophiocordyceps sinensis TaxID=72228 RepID=A0A1X8VJM0_9HYPO|nr:LAGLIDADG endonuclease [Ophiocordyceps sinensis]ARF03415.1 LAGLIDADG endonuclease [Ophiocordyceps sinensis]
MCILFIWYIDAVLVKIQLYKVIFVNKRSTDGDFLHSAHLNTKSVNKYLNKNLSLSVWMIRYFSSTSRLNENFLQWFVGFSDAESNFCINPTLKKDKVTISSFSFMFKIALHKDDIGVLNYLHSKLGVGNVRLYKNECIFNVTDRQGVKLLISIFDKYNLNTSKHLDYLDFKKAFNIYIDREQDLSTSLVKDRILELKNKMNTNRVNFDRPENSKIVITKSWLLGFIEGDGSFFVRRDNLTPVFCIEITQVQLEVLLKIKEFLERSLAFDTYSMYKLKNSSTIAVTTLKARGNSKSSVALTIKNVRVLNNYLVPFLDDMSFLTKKGKDFQDFKILCKVVYNGAYRKDEIKRIMLKLSYTMNNYRLSTNTTNALSLSIDEWDKLFGATPSIEYLYDGRVRDILTGKGIHQQSSCVYEIRELDGEVLMANTLSEAASIVGVYPDTLSKYLDVGISCDDVEHWVLLNNYKVRRVAVFSLR